MKKEIPNPKPLILTEGYFSDQAYDSQEIMAQSSKNWEHHCRYQLGSNRLSGRNKILQLHSMQIMYAHRKGGTMHTVGLTKDSFAIVVIEACGDKACFGRMKLHTGDILFFDNSYPSNFIINTMIQFTVINIPKKMLGSRLSALSKILGHSIHDTDALYVITLNEIWKRFTDPSDTEKNVQQFIEAEEEIFAVIVKLLSEQTPTIPKLTSGEKIALEIRDQVLGHMDGKISIRSLAEEYDVSEQTLQNSFKSLFGFTPKQFFHSLKLNQAYHDLQKSDPEQTTVSEVALKWGFVHMGRFSAYYEELFGEYPSVTLNKTPYCQENAMAEECVDRQEEMS